MKTTNLYIIEEHHEAFWLWNYCIMRGTIKPSHNTLLHVDHHLIFQCHPFKPLFTLYRET